MLEEMRIRSLGVIDDALLPLGPGLTVITGETGAGKTMIVQGLLLLLGGRAEAALVRPGADRAVVEGRLRVDPTGAVASRVDEAGGELDGDELLVSRSVTAEGRSRAHCGGRAVPVGVLAELADSLVAVHGQSTQLRLLHPSVQREALDRFAGTGVAELRADYEAAYARHRAVTAELQRLRTAARERARESELLRFGLDEIAAVDPQPGEDLALRAELERLEHAEALRAAATVAQRSLTGDDDGSGATDVLSLLAGARRALEAVAGHDPALAALAARIAEAGYLLADVGADLASYAAGVEVEPARVAFAQERRAALTALTRKYGADVDGVLAWAAAATDRLAAVGHDDARVDDLAAEERALERTLADLAAQLTAERTAAGDRFAAAVRPELAALSMPHAEIAVALSARDDPSGLPVGGRRLAFGPRGVDEVELLLVPHAGAAARPLAKGASGGELSRVMLAIEVVLAGIDPVPTFVFDEVDAGVGGRAAVEVGRRLARLARSSQVLCVTHLPQVAAFADRHVVVRKSDDGRVTTSDVSCLGDQDRVHELSRMLAGLDESDLARGHAGELLAVAAEERRIPVASEAARRGAGRRRARPDRAGQRATMAR